MTNYSKGTDLEIAIEAIEKIIMEFVLKKDLTDIEIYPKYKKISGYEIDLYVHIKDKKGYDTIFIFECKNWDSSVVGRKEITDFSEKITKSKAQKGFFIAKSFSKDALSRIKEDGRIEKILASNVPNLPQIFWIAEILDEKNSKIDFIESTELNIEGKNIRELKLNGQLISEIDLIGELINPKYGDIKFGDRVKNTFKNNTIHINGTLILNIKKLIATIKYLSLDAKIDGNKIFGIENRGSHLTISHYNGSEKVFDTDITSVQNGDEIQYSTTIYNNTKDIKGVSLKIASIKK